MTWAAIFPFFPVCPEVECGLGVPREAMRLVGDPERPRLVTVKGGVDHTERMAAWAAARVEALASHGLCGFIFKSKSPSSGMERVKVYPEGGRHSRAARGGPLCPHLQDPFSAHPRRGGRPTARPGAAGKFCQPCLYHAPLASAAGRGHRRFWRAGAAGGLPRRAQAATPVPRHPGLPGHGQAGGPTRRPARLSTARPVPGHAHDRPVAQGHPGQARQCPATRHGLFQEPPFP